VGLSWITCPFVFFNEGKGIKDFRASWETGRNAAGIEGKRFHDLRRTAVGNMIRADIPEVVAMRISAHKTRAVFDRYKYRQWSSPDERCKKGDYLHQAAQKRLGRVSSGHKTGTTAILGNWRMSRTGHKTLILLLPMERIELSRGCPYRILRAKIPVFGITCNPLNLQEVPVFFRGFFFFLKLAGVGKKWAHKIFWFLASHYQKPSGLWSRVSHPPSHQRDKLNNKLVYIIKKRELSVRP
jgi:hypothetical protein